MPRRKISPKRLLMNKEAMEYLKGIVGEEGMPIVEVLLKKNSINEFDLAEAVDMQVNVVRSFLYKLYAKKIVTFTKKRDRKKGWFIYTWKIDVEKIMYELKKEKEFKIRMLRNELKNVKDEQMFECKMCNIVVTFAKALENTFLCPYCERNLTAVDSEKLKEVIEKKLKKLEEEKRKREMEEKEMLKIAAKKAMSKRKKAARKTKKSKRKK